MTDTATPYAITDTGSRIHTSTCDVLTGLRHVTPLDREQAAKLIKEGTHRPCGTCKPRMGPLSEPYRPGGLSLREWDELVMRVVRRDGPVERFPLDMAVAAELPEDNPAMKDTISTRVASAKGTLTRAGQLTVVYLPHGRELIMTPEAAEWLAAGLFTAMRRQQAASQAARPREAR